MVVIRLARGGRNKYPVYRIVAAESARAATGKFVAILGHYNPHTKDLVINHAETERFLGHGAQPSNTVVKLLIRDKVELPKWVKLKTKAAKVIPEVAAEASESPSDATPDTEVSAEEASAEASDLEVATDVTADAPEPDEAKVETPDEA